MRCTRLVALMCGALLAGPVDAQDPASAPAIDLAALDLDRRILRQIEGDPDAFLESMIQRLYAVASDGVLTRDEARAQTLVRMAQQRANIQRQVMQYDLDGDGDISAPEIDQLRAQLEGRQEGQLVALAMTADKDADGHLSPRELADYVNRKMGGGKHLDRNAAQVLALDGNRDGRVDAMEIAQVVRAVLAAKEAGTLPATQPAPRPVPAPKPEPSAAKPAKLAVCGYPEVPKGAEVVVVGTHAGAALSDTALVDLKDVTTVAALHIEPGKAPLYLVAGSRTRVIWQLTGDTTRVRRFVSGPNNGVVGLNGAANFLMKLPSACLPQNHRDAAEGTEFIKDISAALGVETVRAGNAYIIGRMSLPTARELLDLKELRAASPRILRNRQQQIEGEDGFRPMTPTEKVLWQLRNEQRRSFPAGIRRFADGQPLAPIRKVSYGDVLPREAGLIRMIEDGRVEVRENGALVIVEALPYLPVGLRNLRIHIAPGVPLPAEQPKSVGIIEELSEECVSGEVCPKN